MTSTYLGYGNGIGGYLGDLGLQTSTYLRQQGMQRFYYDAQDGIPSALPAKELAKLRTPSQIPLEPDVLIRLRKETQEFIGNRSLV